jgi:hypothetical protein
MDTLIVGAVIGIVATLIGTWFDARYRQSTDTRIQLLLKIDDWVNDLILFCDSAYWKLLDDKEVFQITLEVRQDFKKRMTRRCLGIARALRHDCLISQIQELHSKSSAFIDTLDDLITYTHNNPKHEERMKRLETLREELSDVVGVAENVHTQIAEEMMRIFPRWPKRLWNWIKSKV